jgi:hypothetical protein
VGTNLLRWVTKEFHSESRLLSTSWVTNPSTKTWRSDLRASKSPFLYRYIGCLVNLFRPWLFGEFGPQSCVIKNDNIIVV